MKRNFYRTLKYPLRDLDVGDSFDVPIEKLNSASVTAWKFGQRHGMRFSVHFVRDKKGNVRMRTDGQPRVEVERIA